MSSIGIRLRTRFMAGPSSRSPFGSPESSVSITPPSGLFVPFLIPAIFNAYEFTRSTCPHVRVRATGLSGATSSRSYLVGFLCSASFTWSQPLPSTQSPGFDSFTLSATVFFISSMLWTGGVMTLIILSAAPTPFMWTWLSYNPGRTVFPSRSTTSVEPPMNCSASLVDPVNWTTPSFTVSASTIVNSSSTVSILPLTRAKSASQIG